MTPTKVIRRLVTIGRTVIDPFVAEPACILCTSIGIEVLARFGIEATGLSVKVDLMNRIWFDWAQEGGPGGQDELQRRGGWMISGGYAPGEFPTLPPMRAVADGKAWDGHLVIEIPGRGIVDLDLKGFDRPTKNLLVPPAALFEGNGGPFTAAEYTLPGGHRIRYQARRDDTSYQQARDWRERDRLRPTVDDVVRAIRKGTR